MTFQVNHGEIQRVALLAAGILSERDRKPVVDDSQEMPGIVQKGFGEQPGGTVAFEDLKEDRATQGDRSSAGLRLL